MIGCIKMKTTNKQTYIL